MVNKMRHKSYGYLYYESDIIKTPNLLNHNWIILRCCDDLVNYYQYWLNKKSIAIIKSSWKPHLSISRGEALDKAKFIEWIGINGNKIHFDYEDELRYNKKGFVWINCWSKELNGLRHSLGLYLKKDDRFHLTVAKMKDGISYYGIEKFLTYDP